MLHQAPTQTPVDMTSHTLHSHVALDLLTQVAATLTPDAFAQEMSDVFGKDIPLHLYSTLQDKLLAGEIEHPPVLLTWELGREADYDNRERVIRIDWAFFIRATSHEHQHWWLLMALVHEFGHHIDNLLRHDLINNHPSTAADAPYEEGHLFTLWITEVARPQVDELTLATYSITEPPAPDLGYKASWTTACQDIREYLSNVDFQFEPSHNHPDREAFEAGSGEAKGSTH